MARTITQATGVFATAKVVLQSAGTVIETTSAALAVGSEALVSLAETSRLYAEDFRLQTAAELLVERKIKNLELAKRLAQASSDAAAIAGNDELLAALAVINDIK